MLFDFFDFLHGRLRKVEVGWRHAEEFIAGMPHLQVGRNWAVVNHPSDTMRCHVDVVHLDPPAFFVAPSSPKHAAVFIGTLGESGEKAEFLLIGERGAEICGLWEPCGKMGYDCDHDGGEGGVTEGRIGKLPTVGCGV